MGHQHFHRPALHIDAYPQKAAGFVQQAAGQTARRGGAEYRRNLAAASTQDTGFGGQHGVAHQGGVAEAHLQARQVPSGKSPVQAGFPWCAKIRIPGRLAEGLQ